MPSFVHKTTEKARIGAPYAEARALLGVARERSWAGTRCGGILVLVVGSKDVPLP